MLTPPIEVFDGKMNRRSYPFDDEDFGDNDMESDYKNLDIYQRHSPILSLLHSQKRSVL
jgi:hypothetical protein